MTLLWLAAALAQEPSPARLCADAAEGAAIEVCLRLASEYPDQVDELAAALRARNDAASTPDRVLLFALLALLSEASGPQGAEALGDLNDPRAVAPLVYAVQTRPLVVSRAAMRALAHYPEGVAHLGRWLQDDSLPLPRRLTAARSLGAADTAAAADLLLDALHRRYRPAKLERVIFEVVRAHYPERRAELVSHPSSDGTGWTLLGGGLGFGYLMSSSLHFVRADPNPPGSDFNQLVPADRRLEFIGAGTGLLAGGTGAFVAARAWPTSAGDAAFVASSGTVGMASGVLIGATRDEDTGWLLGLGGGTLGYGLGAAFARVHPGVGPDAAEALFVASATAATLGTGFTFIDDASHTKLAYVTAGLGLSGGLVLGHVVAPKVEVIGADWGVIALGAGLGGLAGATVPVGDLRRRGLPVAGMGLGGLVGYGLSGPLDLGWDVAIGGAGGLLFGGAAGAGIGMLASEDGRYVGPVSSVLGAAGLVSASRLAWLDPDPFDDRDLILGGWVVGFSLWQTAGWVAVHDNPRLVGLLPLVPALAGGTVAVLSPWIDWPVTHTTAATSIGLWGAYVGAAGGRLVGLDPLPTALLSSDVALVAGGVLLSPWVGVPPLVIGSADVGGVLLGSVSALGTRLVTRDERAVLSASLLGSGAGFALGAAVGQRLRSRGHTRDVASWRPQRGLPGRWMLTPAALSGERSLAYGVQLQGVGW